jgi:hypothetical protein
MIEWETIRDFDYETPEGKALLAAIAILTSIDCDDIKQNKWGGMTHPDDVIKRISELANKIFYEKEWELERERIKREDKIKSILD